MTAAATRPRVASAAAEGTHIPAQPKRQARAVFLSQLASDLPAVLTVLAAGASAIAAERGGVGRAIAAAELVSGAWVLLTIAREARHVFGRGAGHTAPAAASPAASGWRVDVAGLAAAAMGYVEVWQHAVARGHFKLVSPYMLAATTTLVLALGGRRWIRSRRWYWMRRRRPHLLVTPDAVSYRGGRRTRWAVPWADVAAVEHAPGALTVRRRDGGAHVLRADEHVDGGALLEAARAAVARHAPGHLTA